MNITELIEQFKAMPEKMEGFNSEGELVVLNTHKLAEELKKSLRNCDVGTAEEQYARVREFCKKHKVGLRCVDCPVNGLFPKNCALIWANMPYDKGDEDEGK